MKPFRIYERSECRTPIYYDIVYKHIPQISKLYPYSLQSYWTSKFRKKFAQKRTLPCVTKKKKLTAKLFGVGSSNFGFVHLDNWATHSKNLNKIRRRSAWGFLKICSFDVEWPYCKLISQETIKTVSRNINYSSTTNFIFILRWEWTVFSIAFCDMLACLFYNRLHTLYSYMVFYCDKSTWSMTF